MRINTGMAVLRIDGIDDDTSPFELRNVLTRFGLVGQISLYEDDDLVYALVEMDEDDAEAVIEGIEGKVRKLGLGERWPRIRACMAHTLGQRWLEHSWRPPDRKR